jgi:hypothetical protein
VLHGLENAPPSASHPPPDPLSPHSEHQPRMRLQERFDIYHETVKNDRFANAVQI